MVCIPRHPKRESGKRVAGSDTSSCAAAKGGLLDLSVQNLARYRLCDQGQPANHSSGAIMHSTAQHSFLTNSLRKPLLG